MLPQEIPYFIVRKPNKASPTGYKDFKINKDHILQWLIFLKENNPHYSHLDLEASKERLSQIPDDISQSLRSMEETELEEKLSPSDESHLETELQMQDSTNLPLVCAQSSHGADSHNSDKKRKK